MHIEVDHNGEPSAIIDLKKISVEQEQQLLKAFSIKSVPFRIVFYRSNFNGLFLGEGIQDALEDEQIDVLASFERLLDDIRLNLNPQSGLTVDYICQKKIRHVSQQ